MKSILLLLAIFIMSWNNCVAQKIKYTVPNINIDIDHAEEYYDGSEFLDTTYYKILPLQTEKKCLISSNIKKIFLVNDTLYIFDKVQNALLIFDMNGKYINKILNIGDGPDAYTQMSDVSVDSSGIVILDSWGRKTLFYDLKGNYKYMLPLVNISAQEIFTFAGRIFYINIYNVFSKGYSPYLINSTDYQGKNELRYKHFENNSMRKINPIAYNNYCVSKDGVTFTLPLETTVFKATKDNIVPAYKLDFKGKFFPSEYIYYPSDVIKQKGYDKKYVSWIQDLQETKKYLIIRFYYQGHDSSIPSGKLSAEELSKLSKKNAKKHYVVLYDKTTNKTITTNGFVMEKTKFISAGFICGNYIIYYKEASHLTNGKNRPVISQLNPQYVKQYDKVRNSISEDDNPVLFIFRLKE